MKTQTSLLALILLSFIAQGCGSSGPNTAELGQTENAGIYSTEDLTALVTAVNAAPTREQQIGTLLSGMTSLSIRKNLDAVKMIPLLSERIAYSCPENENVICTFNLINGDL